MTQKNHDQDTLEYELYPLVTGAERLATLEQIRHTFSHARAQQLLAELEAIHGEFDRDLPEIT